MQRVKTCKSIFSLWKQERNPDQKMLKENCNDRGQCEETPDEIYEIESMGCPCLPGAILTVKISKF